MKRRASNLRKPARAALERSRRNAAARARRKKDREELDFLIGEIWAGIDKMTAKVKRMEFLYTLVQDERKRLEQDLYISKEYIEHRQLRLAAIAKAPNQGRRV